MWAVNLAALWGWSVIALPDPVVHMLTGRATQGVNQVLLFALIGLPIAFLVAWIAVAPLLRTAMQKSMSVVRAAVWGGIISAIIVLASIVIGRLHGFLQSMNDRFDSQLGGGDYIREVDGILTAYGWWVVAQSSLMFILACVAGAVFIRLLIGPGQGLTTDIPETGIGNAKTVEPLRKE